MTELAEIADALRIADAPWLTPVRQRLAEAFAGSRFPHAVLIQGRPGTGAEALALWLAHLSLCERPIDGPCGECPSCLLFRAGNHPDLVRIGVEEDASFIKIEQIRDLRDWTGLKAYRGQRKVVIIDPADKLFFNAFNALLKTLEEPPDNAILLLVVTRPEKLPRTVLSRCQRIPVPAPATAVALEWLQQVEPRRDWPSLLELSAGGPLRAIELARVGLGELATDLQDFLQAVQTGRADVLKAAERWARDRPAERLAWLEHWAVDQARTAIGVNSDRVDNNRSPSLPLAPADPKIRACFEFADRVRDARNLLQGSLNTQLLLEGVALAAAELARARAPAGARERTR